MEATEGTLREYYEDSYRFESTGRVVSCGEKDSKHFVVLDKTIFHPQGGGQPSDTGVISTADTEFTVSDLKIDGKTILHYGSFTKGTAFEAGSEVTCKINEESRRLFARIHSAGHLMDICVRNIGLTNLQPGKGFHFPTGAYVEYIGLIPEERKTTVLDELNAEIERLLKECPE